MFRICFGHVSDMVRACFGHVSGMCRGCFGHVSDMVWKVSDKFRCALGVTEGLFLHQCSEYHFTFFVKRNFGAKDITAQFLRAIFSVLRVSPGGFLIAS